MVVKSPKNLINPKIMKKLERIAMDHSVSVERRGGLEIRDNDDDDYVELSVWSIQTIIAEAYILGKTDMANDMMKSLKAYL